MPEKKLHYFQWHITHTCNLRCTHCYQEDYRYHMPEELLFRTLDQYTEYIEKKDYQAQINLTGGEPLLHPAFFRLSKEIKNRGYRLGILTNGTLIDEKMAEQLTELKPVFVQISLDGTEQIHDGIRGAGNFQKALHGIDLLKRNVVKVLVSFTAQKANIQSFPELAAVCKEHQVDKLWWDRVVTATKEEMERLALSTEEFQAFLVVVRKLQKKYRKWNGKSFISLSRSLQAKNPAKEGCYICSAGKELIIVLANGDVMPCRRLPFVIGNVKENSLGSIIEESMLMRRLSTPRFPVGCQGCKRFLYCRGGARCVTYAQTGDLNAKDVNCSVK